MRTIAQKAGATQGLIRHYFSTEDDLIAAAYEQHMTCIIEATGAVRKRPFQDPSARLAGFVTGALTPPVVDVRNVGLWADFLHVGRLDPRMRVVHAKTCRVFRDRLEGLIAAALRAAELPHRAPLTRRLSIASNGVIDGLWLEGSALPDGFDTGELPKIDVQCVGSIIGLDLLKAGA